MTARESRSGLRRLTAADIDASQHLYLRKYSSWQRFHRGPRRSAAPLLAQVSQYPDAVLVAGCQRSGTTMLTRLIADSATFQSFRLTRDDELDAALVLAGYVDLPPKRYCFQTTYLNERFAEYRNLGSQHRLIWVLRNPYSAVYSMVYNWRRFGLNELYESSQIQEARGIEKALTRLPPPLGPSAIHKACHAYSAKTSQILEISGFLSRHQLMVVDYDELVRQPTTWLPKIFEFIAARYDPSVLQHIRADSVGKADRLKEAERREIEKSALPAYTQCLSLVCDSDLRN